MAVSVVTSRGRADSGTVVGQAANATTQRSLFPVALTAKVTFSVPVTALPDGVSFNGDVLLRNLKITQDKELQSKLDGDGNPAEPAALNRSVPTADLLKGSALGFKRNAKMVIKIDLAKQRQTRGADADPESLTFNHFSLQAATETDEERYQLHETFAEEVLFLFGRRPRIWTMAGIVANSDDANYAEDLAVQYEQVLRGSRTTDLRGRRVFIFYEDVLLECTLLGLALIRNSTTPSAVNVSMTIVVHERGYIGRDTAFLDQNIDRLQDESRFIIGKEVRPDDIDSLAPDEEALVSAALAASEKEKVAQERQAEAESRRADALAAVEALDREVADKSAEIANTRAEIATRQAGGEDLGGLDEELQTMEKELRDLEAHRQDAATAVGLEGQSLTREEEAARAAAADSDFASETASRAGELEGDSDSELVGRAGESVTVILSGVVFPLADGQIKVQLNVVEARSVQHGGFDRISQGAPALSASGHPSTTFQEPTATAALSRLSSQYAVNLRKEEATRVDRGVTVTFEIRQTGRRLA